MVAASSHSDLDVKLVLVEPDPLVTLVYCTPPPLPPPELEPSQVADSIIVQNVK